MESIIKLVELFLQEEVNLYDYNFLKKQKEIDSILYYQDSDIIKLINIAYKYKCFNLLYPFIVEYTNEYGPSVPLILCISKTKKKIRQDSINEFKQREIDKKNAKRNINKKIYKPIIPKNVTKDTYKLLKKKEEMKKKSLSNKAKKLTSYFNTYFVFEEVNSTNDTVNYTQNLEQYDNNDIYASDPDNYEDNEKFTIY